MEKLVAELVFNRMRSGRASATETIASEGAGHLDFDDDKIAQLRE